MNTPFIILYHDPYLVAIDKPAGWLVHRSKIDKFESQIVMPRLRDQLQQYVYPVHRLDKPTAGILLFALSKGCAREMGKLFELNAVKKEYEAIVRGYLPSCGKLEKPLKELHDKTTDCNANPNKPPQIAITSYSTIEQVELPYAVGRYDTARFSLVKLFPETGRKHQLRRHLKSISHPIIGDKKYGDWRQNKFFAEQLGYSGLLLFATKLSFPHPITGDEISIVSIPKHHALRIFNKKKGSEIRPLEN